jgi:invasion protein IalB
MRYAASTLLTAFIVAVTPGSAQDHSGAGEAMPVPGHSSWVKLCDTPTVASKDIFGRLAAVGTKTCLIHHESIDAKSGTPLVAAAVRQSGGRQTFTVMVPAGVQQAPGARVVIYPINLWEKLHRKERLDKMEAGRLGTVSLKFAFCHAGGCTAETDATPELVTDLKSNGGLLVLAVRNGKPVGYPVALRGFRAAYDGPPTDSARFNKAREELLRKLRERHKPRVQPPPGGSEQRI